MADLLKNMYNRTFFDEINPEIQEIIPGFDREQFQEKIFSKEWTTLELKQRVRHISLVLDRFLVGTAPERLRIIRALAQKFRTSGHRVQAFPLIFLADYIEVFGRKFPAEAISAIEEVTQLVSCEFAIRPFLIDYFDETMAQLRRWSRHESASVRRLSSEGCRPRLPWAMGVPRLKKDPFPILALLENLREDPSEYVRRSVANNLHDIAKDHPEVVLDLLSRWKGKNELTDWIIRHASRTLTKKGNALALELQGIQSRSKAKVERLTLLKKRVRVGGVLEFEFSFVSHEKQPAKFRIDYGIDYITSTGKISTRIFKITEGVFDSKRSCEYFKRQSFKDLTTRKHFKGKHSIYILVNGRKMASENFVVIGN